MEEEKHSQGRTRMGEEQHLQNLEHRKQQREKRLKKELDIITKDPPGGVTGGPDGEDLSSWSVSIQGPDESPYAGGLFFLSLEYPPNYPSSPPKIRFKTKIYHPNIDSEDGEVFLDVLGKMWCPALTASTILLSIQGLLDQPNPKESIEPDIAEQYVESRKEFERIAKVWTEMYAMGINSEDAGDGEFVQQ